MASVSNDRAACAFFDSEEKPKALVLRNRTQSESMELVDLQTQKSQWRIDNIMDYLDPYAFSRKVACVRLVGDEESISFFSLETGEKLGRFPFLSESFADGCILPYHSPDGRYPIFPEVQPAIFSESPPTR